MAFEEPRTLRVTALSTGEAIKDGVFVEGKDFHLASGRVNVRSESVVSFAYPAGNAFIGVAHESQVLGVDERGDARMQETTTFAGTAFLVIPVAGNTRDAFRFPRASGLCGGR